MSQAQATHLVFLSQQPFERADYSLSSLWEANSSLPDVLSAMLTPECSPNEQKNIESLNNQLEL